MNDTNIGEHYAPHRKNCTCDDCTIEKLSHRIAELLQAKNALLSELAALKDAARWIPFSEKLPVNQAIWIHDGVIVWSDYWGSSRSFVGADWKAWRCREEKPAAPTEATDHE